MSTDPRAVATRYYEILSDWAPERLDEVCAPDLRGHGGAGRNLEEQKASLSGFVGAFPDLSVTVEHLIAEGDVISSWVTMEGTHQGSFAGVSATGNRARFVAWDLLRIENGCIAEITSYCDLFTLMNQIGATPSAASV